LSTVDRLSTVVTQRVFDTIPQCHFFWGEGVGRKIHTGT
jgi:hypothetical protein